MAILSGETVSPVDRHVCAATFAQQRAWVLEQVEPGSALTTVTATVEVSRALSSQVLESSLNRLVERHAILRTTLGMREGQLMQCIAPQQHLSLAVVDLSGLPQAQQLAQAQRLAKEQTQPPFDLSQGPLLRCTLFHLGSEQSRIVLTLHRILVDDWSIGLLVRELASLSEADGSSQSASLPRLSWRDAAVATDQQPRAADLSYWQQQLAQAPEALSLPLDHPRTALAQVQGAIFQAVLPRALSQGTRDLSRAQGVSRDSVLVAAWLTVLARYTGQHDLLIGLSTSARRSVEQEALSGPGEQTLPLRLQLSDQQRFVDLLVQVEAQLEAGEKHGELPLESLLQAVFPTRSWNQQPLFSVLLRLPCPEPALPAGWKLAPLPVGPPAATVDLLLDLQEGLLSRFLYRPDLFEETTIARLAGQWQTLLEGIVADPTVPLAHLPLLTQAERKTLLQEWTATQKPYPQHGLAQLFEAQVQRTPQAVAVRCEGEQVSYRELNRRANHLAHFLRANGVGPETLVALLAERGIPFVVAVLAVFKAGGAYLPLDPHHPAARLRRVLEQSGSRLVLTTAAFMATLSAALEEVPTQARPQSICLEEVLEVKGEEANLPPLGSPGDLVYVIYTSGSTGQPKGAMVEQRGMLNHLFAKIEALNLSETDMVAQTASQCFDISVWQFLAALLVGGGVQIYPDVVAHDAVLLLQQIQAHGVSILETVPSLLAAMLAAQERERSEQPPLSALRWLIPTGEALPVELCRRWLERYPHIPLLNAYGPTECSDDVTHYVIDQPPKEMQRSIPIGKAIPNMRLYVLDKHLEPLPIGVSGELYVGGSGVGRGYLGDAERTAQAFVPDPFVQQEGARLYKTGDRARYLPDGNLEFLGRLDSQVKLRGNRIELGEIETVARQQPGVREAVVLVREDAGGEPQLVAYVLRQEAASVKLEDLKERLKKLLPAYMVPTAWVLLDKLPLTANGKLDRKALPAPEPGAVLGPRRYVAPVEPLHRQLAVIWEEVLGVKPIGIRDDFFELGGDSLRAVQVFERIAAVCGQRLSLSTLFAGASIEQVAKALQKTSVELERAALVVVQSGGRRRPFFFLHGQWRGGAFYSRELARRMGPEQPFYLLEPYKFEGQAVPATFEQMAAAHLETLRRVQPQGPYRLGGWCNGGLMAYEMARQLQAVGERVELLVMMDADAPATPFKGGYHAIADLGQRLGVSKERQVDWFLLYRHWRLSYHYWRLRTFTRALQVPKPELEPGLLVDDESAELDTLLPSPAVLRQDWLSILDWTTSGYQPQPYAGPITFFWAEQERIRKERWRPMLEAKLIDEEQMQVHIVPGNHITSRTQYLPVLAEHLSMCLSLLPQ